MNNKKKPGLVSSMVEVVKGNIFPTKAPPATIPKNFSGLDLVKFGASLSSPSIIKIDVNMANKDPIIYDQQPPQQQPPQIINNYYYNYQNSDRQDCKPAIPESCTQGIVIDLPDQPIKTEEQKEEPKKTDPAKEMLNTLKIVKENQQTTSSAAFKGFEPVPEKPQDKSTIISPIPGINMDILKKDTTEPDLSPEAIKQDQETMGNVLSAIGYAPQSPVQQYYPQYGQYPHAYNPAFSFQQQMQQQHQSIISDVIEQNTNVDLSEINIPVKDSPKPNRLPDNIQPIIPNVPKPEFHSKFDNKEIIIKYPELAEVQSIAEKNDVHVQFIECVFEDGNQNSGIVQVNAVNKNNQPISFKSFYIDFKRIIDNRIKVFPRIGAYLEGQQAYSYHYIPSKKEKKEGITFNKSINEKLFNDIFSGGILMLNESDGLYNQYKIESNRYCDLITLPTRCLKSDERAKMIGLVQTMAMPNGIFETCLGVCPGSRWKFEATDGKGLTHRNFVLTNVNVPLHYGSIPRMVPKCRIISLYRDKKHYIVVDINDTRYFSYEVDKELSITPIQNQTDNQQQ